MRQSFALIAVLATTAYAYSKCPPNGNQNIAHEKDCGLYYECNEGKKTEQQCTGGLSFNPASGLCGWPPRSECLIYADLPDQECPANIHLAKRIPHDCCCTRYYECFLGKKLLQACDNGTKFDYVREVCDVPERVQCYKDDEIVLMAEKQNVCPATGTVRLPHEYNCNLYYQCTNGMKYLGKCLVGHYYNDLIQACDLPENVNCNNKVPTTTTMRTDGDECPACNCDNCYTRYPHDNCSLYYECNNGTKTVHECPEGLLFNPVTQICDWPDNVNCTIKEPTCTVGNRTHHECNCEKYYECEEVGWVVQRCPPGEMFDHIINDCVPENEAICWPEIEPPPGCMETCLRNESKIVAHENCRQYCECNHGNMTVVDCYENMYYNEDKRKCDWPENIRNLTCIPFPCPNNVTNVTVPHECTCDLYYECKNGVLVREECPPGTEFNYEMHGCFYYEHAHCYKEVLKDTHIESEECMGVCPMRDPSDRSYVMPHKNCTKFCRCGVGAAYVVQCKPGLHFNPEKGTCTAPALAKCNKFYMYGFEERDSLTHSTWHDILPYYNNK